MQSYSDFLESKRHCSVDYGYCCNFIPDNAFDFQKYIISHNVKKGREAGFIDTGLGKTLIELSVAKNYLGITKKPTLIITPLAVAFQFITESKKFGIDDVSYSKDGKINSKIVICNYERIEKFNPDEFGCVILDESSILKNFEGAIKNMVTGFLKKVKYRFLYSATPSPNDYIELGTSSEALGYMGYMDMLSRFFKNNNNNVVKFNQAQKANMGLEWYLKPHAEKDFWQWVSSWSICARKPSDLGYGDDLFVLPNLIEDKIFVKNKNPLDIDGQIQLFNFPATNFREIKAEVRNTIQERCEKVVELSQGVDIYVSWVNLNDEAKKIKEIDNSFIEICGAMDLDEKEEILLSFSKGEIKRLITKSSITAFGLNWQHCNRASYFPTFSYEQYYQSIRRFWRFGQKKDVKIDLVMSDGQTRILDALMAKKEKAINMFQNLIDNVNGKYKDVKNEFSKEIIKPSFLGVN